MWAVQSTLSPTSVPSAAMLIGQTRNHALGPETITLADQTIHIAWRTWLVLDMTAKIRPFVVEQALQVTTLELHTH